MNAALRRGGRGCLAELFVLSEAGAEQAHFLLQHAYLGFEVGGAGLRVRRGCRVAAERADLSPVLLVGRHNRQRGSRDVGSGGGDEVVQMRSRVAHDSFENFTFYSPCIV